MKILVKISQIQLSSFCNLLNNLIFYLVEKFKINN